MNGQPKRNKDFYSYVVNFAALAAGASATQNFSIDTDGDFVLTSLTYQADLAGAALTESGNIVPLCVAQITDGGSSRQLFSQSAPVPAIFGRGDNPFNLPGPRLLVAGSTINVALENYSDATAYNIRMVFIGVKQYHFGNN